MSRGGRLGMVLVSQSPAPSHPISLQHGAGDVRFSSGGGDKPATGASVMDTADLSRPFEPQQPYCHTQMGLI